MFVLHFWRRGGGTPSVDPPPPPLTDTPAKNAFCFGVLPNVSFDFRNKQSRQYTFYENENPKLLIFVSYAFESNYAIIQL